MIAVEVNYTEELHKRADSMRTNPTVHELRMRKKLERFDVQFFEQHVIGWYIVDFVLPGRMLIIEIDGSQHHTSQGKCADHKRSQWLKSLGFTILRIPNSYVKRFPTKRLKSFPLVGSTRWPNALAKADRCRGERIVTVEVKEEWERPSKNRKKRLVEVVAKRKAEAEIIPCDDLDWLLDIRIERELLKP